MEQNIVYPKTEYTPWVDVSHKYPNLNHAFHFFEKRSMDGKTTAYGRKAKSGYEQYENVHAEASNPIWDEIKSLANK